MWQQWSPSLNPLAVGVGIQRYQWLVNVGIATSQSPRGRGRYSTDSKCTRNLLDAGLNPLAVEAGIQHYLMCKTVEVGASQSPRDRGWCLNVSEPHGTRDTFVSQSPLSRGRCLTVTFST